MGAALSLPNVCAKCDEPIDDGRRSVAVGDGMWHDRCALGHLIESLSVLTAPAPKLLTAKQVAEQIGTSADTVNRLARARVLGCFRLTRPDADEDSSSRRFRQEHVDAYLDAREQLADDDAVVAEFSRRQRRSKSLSARQQKHRSLVPRSQRDRQTEQR